MVILWLVSHTTFTVKWTQYYCFRISSSSDRQYWIGLYHPNNASSYGNIRVRRLGWRWTDGSAYSWGGKWRDNEPGVYEHIVRLVKNSLIIEWVGTRNDMSSTDQQKYGPYRHICEMGKFSFILFLQKGCEPAAYEDVATFVHSYWIPIRLITITGEWKSKPITFTYDTFFFIVTPSFIWC